MLAIYKRAMRSYFTSVIGYVFLVAYLAIGGAVFAYTTLFSMSADVTAYYMYMMIVCSVLLPLLTMKSFSEERKNKTEQLVLTAPLSLTGLVLGKFFAAYTVFAGALFVNSLAFLLLYRYALVKTALLLGNLIALLLVGMVYIAIGLFVSALTENQLYAAVGTFAIILAFLMIGILNSLLPSTYWLRYVLDCISVFTRFQAFSNGYFDIVALLYYLSLAAVFLYLSVRVFDRRRYR